MGRFDLATGRKVPEEPKPEKSKNKEPLSTNNPGYQDIVENYTRAIELVNALGVRNNFSNPLQYELPENSNRAPRSESLRIIGPGGNQVIIPFRNMVAYDRPIEDGYHELIIRMSRSEAESIMSDIREAQRRRGIPTPRQGL